MSTMTRWWNTVLGRTPLTRDQPVAPATPLPPAPGSVTRLAVALASDDDDARDAAARGLIDCFGERLLGLARGRLAPRLRLREDEFDVLQSVCFQLCHGLHAGRLVVRNRHDLWSLLACMTVNKCRRAAARHYRICRDVRRETPDPGEPSHPDAPNPAPIAPEPGPDDRAAFAEDLRRFHDYIPSPLRAILVAKLEGFTHAEIAARLGRSERTVDRKVSLLRRYWLELHPEDAALAAD